MSMEPIKVIGARENNLKNITISIPKNKITVFTGVSGSGKSSLIFDTIAAESQRQLNETFTSFVRHRLPHYGQPDVDAIEHLSVAILVDQKRIGGNARSTVGTVTDIYSLLRLLFSRIGQPFVGYSDRLSFNNLQGMCPMCEGLGTAATINLDRLIDKDKSLNEGAIMFPTFQPGGYRWKRYVTTGLFDNDKKLKDYTEEEWDTLLYKSGFKPANPTSEWPSTAIYEGVIPRIENGFLAKDSKQAQQNEDQLNYIVEKGVCPECNGARLNQKVLSCKIDDLNIAEYSAMQVSDLSVQMRKVTALSAKTIVEALIKKLDSLVSIGLGYLSLNRETSTLSGGESQRIKMIRHLGSSLTGLTYIFDEPSIGLHPRDVDRLNRMLRQLCSKGNTVLVVEHDPDVIAIADHIVDMGPEAGIRGGEIKFEGDVKGLKSAGTITGHYLRRQPKLKENIRKPDGFLRLEHASLHNLKDVSVTIPTGVMTVVTGVAGSGKSTLINKVLLQRYPDAISIDQSELKGSKRSNLATYTGTLDHIRDQLADANQVSASLFSFNSDGACPACKGLGTITVDLAFMDPVVSVCEACQGRRFTDEVLEYTLHDKNINDILNLSVVEAYDFFNDHREMVSIFSDLSEVGLGYVTLGQPLHTLSGGERQRVRLAMELHSKQSGIYVFDEPTTGLHLRDVERLIDILNQLVDRRSTVIIIEHHLDVMTQADWIVDMGPGAGSEGGKIIFEGTPQDLVKDQTSITGVYLNSYLEGEESSFRR